MQNIDPGENNDTLNKFENLQLTQPTSLESLTCEQHQLLEDSSKAESSRTIQSDPEETQAKTKTRSRFSSALKKLSRSTRKKEKPNIKGSSTATESSEQIISSGAEDLPESNLSADDDKKSKKKKKSGKSLFGLKKSKVAAKQDPEAKQNFEEQETAKLLEPIFQDNENEVVITTERLTPLNSRSKVQITIKSKKIETVASQEQLNKNPSTPKSSPTPSPTNNTKTLDDNKPKTTDTVTKSSDETLDKSKKLKPKHTTQTTQKLSTTTATAQSKSKQQEEITITQSSKDTPPKERAPTKPSRLTTTTNTSTTTSTPTSQTSTSSGAIRKTATTTRAAIKLVTGAKSKQKSSSSKTAKGSSTAANTSAAAATDKTVAATKKETELMINPQRGHRLPRPTSTITPPPNTVKEPQLVEAAVVEPTTATATHATQAIDHTSLPTNSSIQKQLQPTTPDSLTTCKSLPQTSAEIQSSSTNASLATPPTPPISITTTSATDDITTVRQQQQENIQTSPIDNSNSVQLKTFLQADDHISLAESVKPGDYSGDTHYDSLEAIKEPVTVHFAVGSPVRAPFQQSLFEFNVQEPANLSEKYIDDKDTSLAEANRRRIHYISQSSIYDELNSLELKRSHYRYQSGVSDLSLDTDENQVSLEELQQMPAFGDLTMDQDMEPTVMTSSSTEKREHLYKILVIGELGTGKTSFIKRYVHQFFSQNYRATIGVDFALKVLHWDPNTIVRLQLWDIAGQERFGNMTRVYYKEAVGAFIVFDVTRSGTFDCVSKWKEDLDSKVQLPDGSPIPCILLANKCDQDKQGVVTNTEKMDEYVKEHGFAGWFETSAKENINIDEAARALVNKILLNDKLISAADLADSEKFNLNNTGDQTALDGKNKCSC
ncbi:serine-rich adhesin for platelets isoform X1 [Lucilia sericata]|uniref:serine-rich adhesin for platelets isoform X1 n=1 Tax=Lucilia sericata TaxID=13632 RepID=UPI0018A7F07A|nr:serine-rich adhesin for platelets isoform X1 [Lucilia sericata]